MGGGADMVGFPSSPALARRLERLFARRTFGIKPGLDSVRALLAALGDPQRSFRTIHVAGTDGKGSTCVFLDGMLRAAGLRTGLYLSPHLVRLTERFSIAGREMDEDTLAALVDEVETACATLVAQGRPEPTFFETTTALCALWFAREGVPLAVAEVGMGGRLDATNALESAVSAITRIGLDHTQFLGPTIRDIAREKAGIARAGVPLVLGAMPEEAEAEIRRVAADVGAPVISAPDNCSVRFAPRRATDGDEAGSETARVAVSTAAADYGTARIALIGAYQAENVATAVTAFEALQRSLGVSLPAETVPRGLGIARLPGRFQRLCGEPRVWLDGAHNPCAAEALVGALRAARAAKSVRLVCGMCADKDPAGFLRVLSPVAAKVWTVPLSNPRGLHPEKLGAFARGAGFREVFPCATLEEGLAAARRDAAEARAPMVVAGSLFLAGDVLAGGFFDR